MKRFQGEMSYNPRMFLWRNSTDIEYISDVIKIIDRSLFVMLLIFCFLIIIYVCASHSRKSTSTQRLQDSTRKSSCTVS